MEKDILKYSATVMFRGTPGIYLLVCLLVSNKRQNG